MPGVAGLSENIRVIRLVDQFLEHGRVAIFHNGGEEEMYLASADWMDRNLHRRIEVGFPVYNPQVKAEIRQIIDFQLSDNTKARQLDAQHQHQEVDRPPSETTPAVRAQTDTYAWLRKQEW
ncbi:MAG: hypothetical protein H7Z75_07425 [Ferruginibacter sp.]|nr:hypothetical protein [Cytophagales bacterium]